MTDIDSYRAFVPYPAAAVPGAAAGPLAGLRFGVKDIFDVAGYPTGCGNPHKLALSGIRTAHAKTVGTLLDAGAVFAGKTYTDELAFSMNGKNAHFGAPRNGRAPDRITGGSSSGSAAAVSNSLCDFALGTDTGGSVRAPASHCGLIGLRPTHARVSLAGCMDLSPGFDTCGWFARDLPTFAKVGEVLLGADTVTLPEQPEFVVPDDLLAGLAAPVRAAFDGFVAKRADVFGKPAAAHVAAPSLDALYWAFRYVQGYEAWQSHGADIERYGFQLGPGVSDRFRWSSAITRAQYDEHQGVRQQFRAALLALLGNRRVIVMPTMPDVAPRLADSEASLEDYRNQAIRMLCPAGLAGCPQLSLPLLGIDGVPLGLSLVGPPGSDRALIALAARLLD
ncbi:amidase [Burkholderia sp. WAC0059]|uniref:amidase n=1 Tax=Burkholderia sp. WAC0059 TaxID=2066022 RepID=UPI000C7F1DDB|nr:amidase [Burkholderia sp. WAC0059]PLZ03854.1 amidase [Burkholderia sp. WAC0059]